MSKFIAIVYEIIFLDRKQENKKPFRYIGSKSNAIIKDGKIYSKNGRQYVGSSSYPNWREMVLNSRVEFKILGIFNNHSDCINYERELHIANNVVYNEEFFNMAIATTGDNTFQRPGYGTYKCAAAPEKRARLRVDDPRVLDGTFVGITKGYKRSNPSYKGVGNFKHHITGERVRLKVDDSRVISGEYVGLTKGVVFSEEEKLKRRKPTDWFNKLDQERRMILSKQRSIQAKHKSKEHELNFREASKGTAIYINLKTLERKRMKVNEDHDGWELLTTWQVKQNKHYFHPKEKCKHCGKISTKQNIVRWHNDKCRYKKNS